MCNKNRSIFFKKKLYLVFLVADRSGSIASCISCCTYNRTRNYFVVSETCQFLGSASLNLQFLFTTKKPAQLSTNDGNCTGRMDFTFFLIFCSLCYLIQTCICWLTLVEMPVLTQHMKVTLQLRGACRTRVIYISKEKVRGLSLPAHAHFSFHPLHTHLAFV